MSTFALDLQKFAEKAQGNAEKVVRKVGIDLFSKTVERTPVDTGRARANWNCSIGTPSLATSEQTDKGGEVSKARIKNTLYDWKEGDLYLMNSLPYIRRLEYDPGLGRGWSKQAPAGMVRISVAEFQTFVDAATRTVNP